ncbi:MAG: restriction endonuclease subunit S [Proteobacteria bacterium]|nr:restriction endonuclease subunit S [Pseudomonadota bacterium]
MTQHNDIPRIRFKGFTGKWERKKLGEMASFSKGQGYSKSDIKQEGVPIILYGSMYTNYKTIIESVTTYTDLKNNSVISKGGEVIVPASGETAEDIAVASAIIQDGVILGGDLNIVYPNSQLSPVYLANVISHGDAHSDIAKRAQGKSVVHIHNSDLQDIDISFPSLNEQRAIGAYFAHLDVLIEAESQKLDKLKNMKKSCLEKMFPKPGCDVPEVRFKNFTGKWERKKLRELINCYSFRDYLAEPEISGHFEVIQQGDCPIAGYADGKPFYEYESVTLFGDHTLSLYKPCNPFFVASDGVKILTPKGIDPVLFYYILWRYKPNSEGYKRHFTILLEQYCHNPSTLAEQRAIGAYFAHLDELIEAQEQKVEKLRRVKKACLEGMFV